MYTILMQGDGSLVCTTPAERIRQYENYSDSLRIIVPKQYKTVDLTEFTGTIKYTTPANIAKIEYLTVNNTEYKNDYIEYRLPITTNLTQFSGDITLYLTFTKSDEIAKRTYAAYSGEITLTVDPVNDYFTDPSSLQSIDQKIAELQNIAQAYDKAKADNIARDGEEIYLTSNGEQIGDRINAPDSADVEKNFEVVVI